MVETRNRLLQLLFPRKSIRESYSDRVFLIVAYTVLFLVGFVCVFPLLFVLSVSLTPITEVFRNGGFILIPRKFTFAAYKFMLNASDMPRAFRLTVILTILGTTCNMILTTLLAYPLSRKELPGQRYFLFYIIFTMLFNGGLIPTYLVVRNVGLLDTIWAMIIPNVVWAYNTMIMKSFFQNLPNEIFESARMDGAGEWLILGRLVLPLSMPVIATISLFYAVGHWNEFFQAIFYVTRRDLKPLQVVLRGILLQSEGLENVNVDDALPTQTMQMAAVVFAALPIICVYPFLQKYFVKGVLLGSVKG
jgi:putative aldouronate transport system permease protein